MSRIDHIDVLHPTELVIAPCCCVLIIIPWQSNVPWSFLHNNVELWGLLRSHRDLATKLFHLIYYLSYPHHWWMWIHWVLIREQSEWQAWCFKNHSIWWQGDFCIWINLHQCSLVHPWRKSYTKFSISVKLKHPFWVLSSQRHWWFTKYVRSMDIFFIVSWVFFKSVLQTSNFEVQKNFHHILVTFT